MQSYWKMNRLGFINFWKFKKEEIFFSDGCALVRGHNGSGKSIIIQSAIPFLLDGSMRKLDPSGGNAREMSYYLIGEDKKDATAYVFLEFIKNHSYRTIGIGMRARRNKGIDFWGFGLSDGRRVEHDFSLYKNGIPLSKQECRSVIGSSSDNFFVDKRMDYEKAVNQMLFGLSPFRYKELLGLLSEIRKPIAGTDRSAGLKFIYDKLNSSLSALREEDFDALASSMEMMDEYRESLQILRDDYEKIRHVAGKYQDYLDSLSYQRYLHYEKESAKLKNLLKQQEKAIREYEEILAKRKQAYVDLNSAEIELSENDLSETYPDQEKRRTRLALLKEQLDEYSSKSREAQDKMDQCDYDLAKSKEHLDEIHQSLGEMEEEFTWTPDLAKRVEKLIVLTMRLEAMPAAKTDLSSLKQKMTDSLRQCMIFNGINCLSDLTDILDDNALSSEEKIQKSQACLLKTFLQTNNHYIERNAFVKYQQLSEFSKDRQDEVNDNLKKLDLLFQEFGQLPSLTPLIFLDPEIEEERASLKREINALENTSLFPAKHSAKEYRLLLEQIKTYENLIRDQKIEEAAIDKKKELASHFASIFEEYEDKVLESRGEINLLEKTMDERYSDVMALRETIIEKKSLIRNLDSYVIPDRKERLGDIEESLKNQQILVNSFEEYKDLSRDILKKYQNEDSFDREHQLIEEFMRQKMALTKYHPLLNWDEKREEYSLRFTFLGKEQDAEKILTSLADEIREKDHLLSEEENNIYQKVLMDCLVEKINHQISYSEEWIQRIRENMLSLETTSGMVFGIRWIRTKKIDDFSEYFKNYMESYREENEELNYMDCIMECLDYRNWFEFKLEMNGTALSNRRFLTLSGGERATAIYSTLLSALTSMFNECSKDDHPRLFALDEAFTVVDSENIESVFGFISSVGLDYLMNSQTLWGTYPTVPSLSISNLTNLKDSKSVIVHRFLWKNNRKIPQFLGN